MMNVSNQKNIYFMDEEDFDFVDDLLDEELFDSYVEEQFDYETMKLLENF